MFVCLCVWIYIYVYIYNAYNAYISTGKGTLARLCASSRPVAGGVWKPPALDSATLALVAQVRHIHRETLGSAARNEGPLARIRQGWDLGFGLKTEKPSEGLGFRVCDLRV